MRTTDERGAAAVEFALVLPFLLLVVFGIIDFGRAYNAQITLTHAAREAVRVWALGGTTSDVTAAAEAAATGLSGIVVQTSACTFGAATRVTVKASFAYLTPIGSVTTGTHLQAEGVMRCGG